MSLDWWIWGIAAIGNAVDYWATRYLMNVERERNPSCDATDGELNFTPRKLMRAFPNPFAPFLVMQAVTAALFYLMQYTYAGVYLFCAGLLVCSGYYTLMLANAESTNKKTLRILREEKVHPIIWSEKGDG